MHLDFDSTLLILTHSPCDNWPRPPLYYWNCSLQTSFQCLFGTEIKRMRLAPPWFTWSALTEIDCNVCPTTIAVVAGQDEGLVEKHEGRERVIWVTGWSMSGLQLRNATDMRVSIVQFTSSSSCSGVLRVWVEVTFPSVENLKAGLPFMSPSFWGRKRTSFKTGADCWCCSDTLMI